MDFQKLDPVLAAELSLDTADLSRQLPVFVHVTESLEPDEAALVARRFGLAEPVAGGGVLSATLTAQQVAELSEEPWVVKIRAARELRPLD
ncbi:MAG TPA: hypothetical protein VFZ32_05495 [Micromonosporaceae bacterium]